MPICPKWNTLAAKAASALPQVKASLKCSMVPAPPLAMMGMDRLMALSPFFLYSFASPPFALFMFSSHSSSVLVGREILSRPNVLITAYPVRGLDINSSYMIYNILNSEKESGAGILFIGEDLDVMLALCDKIMVLCHGKNMGIVHADKTTKEELGLMMTGALDLTEKNKDKTTMGNAREIYPVREGVVVSVEDASLMMSEFIKRLLPEKIFKPQIRAVVMISSGLTVVERRDVETYKS